MSKAATNRAFAAGQRLLPFPPKRCCLTTLRKVEPNQPARWVMCEERPVAMLLPGPLAYCDEHEVASRAFHRRHPEAFKEVRWVRL